LHAVIAYVEAVVCDLSSAREYVGLRIPFCLTTSEDDIRVVWETLLLHFLHDTLHKLIHSLERSEPIAVESIDVVKLLLI
jgi:hypothetical protein